MKLLKKLKLGWPCWSYICNRFLPIASSRLDYQENYKDYLTEDEAKVFESKDLSGDDYNAAAKKLLDAYYADLPNLEPVAVEDSVVYVKDGTFGHYSLVNGGDFKRFVDIVIGDANVAVTE